MKFSVVIPLYNKRRFVGLTLQSVLAQTLRDFEVIVVDDGSTDNSAEIAEACLQGFPRYQVIRQTNGGVSAARNHGIARSGGEWVAFLDADDYWHPDFLATLAALIAAHPAVDMVATNLHTLPDTPNWSAEPWPDMAAFNSVEVIPDLYRRWFQGIPFITSSVAVRAETLRRMQPCFAVGESNGEDLDLWFRLSEQTPIARSAKPLLAYREAPAGGLSSNISKVLEAPYLHRLQLRALNTQLPKAQRASIAFFLAQNRISMARHHLEIGDRRAALQALVKARSSAYSVRWMNTFLMTLAFPRSWVQRWDAWRYRRKAVHG